MLVSHPSIDMGRLHTRHVVIGEVQNAELGQHGCPRGGQAAHEIAATKVQLCEILQPIATAPGVGYAP